MASLAEHGIVPFELVVVNLYPFEETIARAGRDASTKRSSRSTSAGRRWSAGRRRITRSSRSPASRRSMGEFWSRFARRGATTPELRRELAGAAFAHTAQYDTAIAAYFAQARAQAASGPRRVDVSGANSTLTLRREAALRYGENPHQAAARVCVARCHAQFARACQATARQGAVVQQPARSRQRAGDRRGRCRCRASR